MSDNLWQVTAELLNRETYYRQWMDDIVKADRFDTVADWALESFLTQWPNDEVVVAWSIATWHPADLDGPLSSCRGTVFSTEFGPSLDQVRNDIRSWEARVA